MSSLKITACDLRISLLSRGLSGSLALIILAGQAAGQDINWLGGGGLWNDPTKWEFGNIPSTPSENAILGGDAGYTVTMSNGFSFGALTISNPGVILEVPPGVAFTQNGAGLLDGVVFVNSTGANSTATWNFNRTLPGVLPLTGAGTIFLNASASNVGTARLNTVNNTVVSIGAGLTVSGTGTILGRYQLAGDILANDIFGNSIYLQGVTITGAGGEIIADGAPVSIDSWNSGPCSFTGVPMTAVNGGYFNFVSANGAGATLTNLTVTGDVVSGFAGNIFLNNSGITGDLFIATNAGVIVSSPNTTINGDVLINQTAGGSTAQLRFDQTGELLGAGTITLNAAPASIGTAALSQNSPTGVTTIGNAWTIRGLGRLFGRIDFAGTISPGTDAPFQHVGQIDNAGTLNLTPESVVEIDIASPSSFDRITGSGARNLSDATLVVRFVEGFTPTTAVAVTILPTGGLVGGQFGEIITPPGFRAWAVYNPGFPSAPNSVTLTVAPDCAADLAEPFGLLDLADITAFVAAFAAQDLAADLAEPFGLLDLSDVVAFVTSFTAGCP
jgi:hypothetical protein